MFKGRFHAKVSKWNSCNHKNSCYCFDIWGKGDYNTDIYFTRFSFFRHFSHVLWFFLEILRTFWTLWVHSSGRGTVQSFSVSLSWEWQNLIDHDHLRYSKMFQSSYNRVTIAWNLSLVMSVGLALLSLRDDHCDGTVSHSSSVAESLPSTHGLCSLQPGTTTLLCFYLGISLRNEDQNYGQN